VNVASASPTLPLLASSANAKNFAARSSSSCAAIWPMMLKQRVVVISSVVFIINNYMLLLYWLGHCKAVPVVLGCF
jgi:hypothetical protein